MPGTDIAQYMLPKDLKLINTKVYKYGFMWEVKKKRQAFEVCPKCASPSNTRCGRRTSTVKDTPLQDRAIWLKIHKHRYYCKTCRKPFTESVSIVWPKRRTTQRLRKHIAKQCHNYSSLKKVTKNYSVSSGFIYSVYYSEIAKKLNEYNTKRWPTVLGIDEHFFRRKKGYTEYVTVFTDIKKKRLFDLAETKSSKKLIEQIKHIPGREDVKLVTIDMSSSYKALVRKFFPNAKIISDKFHALRLLTPYIMKAGKKIHGHRQELRTRRMLLCNRKKLDYFLRSDIDHYLKDKSDLNELYRAKERFYEIYRMKGYDKARKALDKFIESLKDTSLLGLQRFRRTLKKWKEEILLYFKYRYTNAFTEAMNNTAKVVQKQGYGYKSFKNYRLRVLSACYF